MIKKIVGTRWKLTRLVFKTGFHRFRLKLILVKIRLIFTLLQSDIANRPGLSVSDFKGTVNDLGEQICHFRLFKFLGHSPDN